jgi:hypothetical protein
MDFNEAESRGYKVGLDKDAIIESMRLREKDYRAIIFYLLDKCLRNNLDEVNAKMVLSNMTHDLIVRRPPKDSYHCAKIDYISSI